MNDISYILIPISVFLLALIFFIFIIALIRKLFKIKSSLKIGLIFAILHFFIVILFDIYIRIQSVKYSEAYWGWMLFVFIDLPVTLFFKYLKFPHIFTDNPYIYFGLFGSLQYFIIGSGLNCILNKVITKFKPLTNQ